MRMPDMGCSWKNSLGNWAYSRRLPPYRCFPPRKCQCYARRSLHLPSSRAIGRIQRNHEVIHRLYSPSPSRRGQGEEQIAPERARAGTTLPYAHAKSALRTRCQAERNKLAMRREAPYGRVT
jgi:hypothetical protein